MRRPPLSSSSSRLALVLSFLAPLVSARAAQASYSWTAPGTTCQPSKPDTTRVNYVGAAAFNESTTTTAKVSCPIPYEYYTFASGTFAPSLSISYLDPNTAAGAARVSCTLVVVNPRNQTVFTSTQTSTLASPDWQDFNFAPAATLFNGTYTMSVSCTLPFGPAAATRSGLRTLRLFR